MSFDGSDGGTVFDQITNITIDPLNDIWVLDNNKNLIQKFSSSGKFKSQWELKNHISNPLKIISDQNLNLSSSL